MQNDHDSIGSVKVTKGYRKNHGLAELQQIPIQQYLADIVPLPIATSRTDIPELENSFSSILANSIYYGIRDFNHTPLPQHHNDNRSLQALRASCLIGRRVLIACAQWDFRAKQLKGYLQLPKKCLHIFIYIENAQAEIVKIIPLGDSEKALVSFIWQGDMRSGEQAPVGQYQLIVSAIVDGKVMQLTPLIAEQVTQVTVATSRKETCLWLANGQTVQLSDVQYIERK
ncbi:flagellar hook assembly protein FlgD [Thalassotalea maritima]|uniref:flagellar hook assembly protein FlgD n=1 Tax=Thalassotalea maritima TaxID=3242416 RepID=UPI003526E911